MTALALICAASLLAAPDGIQLSGTVEDAEGAAIASAVVWLDQDRVVQRTETDESGAFAFSGLKLGAVEVVAWREGHSIGGADAFLAGSGSMAIRLGEPGSARLRVLDVDSHPIHGARIKSMVVGGAYHVSVEDLSQEGFPASRSDERGVLEVTHVPKDALVTVVVAHAQFVETQTPPLSDGKELGVIMKPGVPLRGRVTDEAGRPLARARVSLFAFDESGQREISEVMADPEGFYALVAPPGEYFMAVKTGDYVWPAPDPILLLALREENVFDLTLPSPRTITGRVLGVDGTPVGGVHVAYVSATNVIGETLTAADGTYRFEAPPGEGMVRAQPPAGLMPKGNPEVLVKTESAKNITVPDIRFRTLPRIEGTVVDPDGATAAGTIVNVENLYPRIWAVTDAEGRFSFQLSVAPEASKVLLRAEHALRFLRGETEADLRATAPLTVALEPFEPDVTEGPAEGKHEKSELPEILGKSAPEIVCGVWFNSEPVTAERAAGKVIVLTLWGLFGDQPATRDRLGQMQALYAAYRESDDVLVLGIHDAGIDPAEVQRYVGQLGLEFPVGQDAEPSRTFDAYQTRVIPQTFVIDKRGVLRCREPGPRLFEWVKALRRESAQ